MELLGEVTAGRVISIRPPGPVGHEPRPDTVCAHELAHGLGAIIHAGAYGPDQTSQARHRAQAVQWASALLEREMTGLVSSR